ncbi:hypothetical protein ABG067_006224 [Albugo candida]
MNDRQSRSTTQRETSQILDTVRAPNLILFDASKKELFHPSSGYKKLARQLRSTCKIETNKTDLSSDRIQHATVIVFAGIRERFSSTEFSTLKEYIHSGGSVLLMLGEGGEQKFDTNLNIWLKDYGISINSDSVIRTVYHKYHHPKEVLISNGVINREIARAACVMSGKKEVAPETSGSGPNKPPQTFERDQRGLTFVYPYGATLNVKKPSAPILSTGFISFPVNRAIAAVWQEGSVSAPSSAVQSGRLMVMGSGQCFTDEWIDKEENSKLQEIIFRWLLGDASIQLDPVDAEDPDIYDYNRLPDTQALSERLRSCMQESEDLPKDFTQLFDSSLFKFDTSLISQAVSLYSELGIKKEPLSLISPQFELPLPALKPAVFNPILRELPFPALDQFDLDEHFASQHLRLAQLTNKCSDDDLEYYIKEAADILGILPKLEPECSDAKHVLEFIFTKIVKFKKMNHENEAAVQFASGISNDLPKEGLVFADSARRNEDANRD